jgi:E3 ubiquitin-protein ligase RFWD3
VLFVKRLVALDTSARDVLLRQLEDERIAKKRLQESETKLRLAYGLVSAEVNLLKEQLRMLQETGPNQQFSLSNARFVRAVNFDPKIQCRCIAFDPHLQLFVVGVNLWQNNGNNGKGFGIAKVSILDASRLDYLHGLHEQFVKSLHCSPFADGLVLTTSFDRTLKLSSLNTNGTLLSYELCAPGWSCSFHPTDRNLLFAGMANGTVSMYDIRNTRNAEWTVAVTSKSGDPMPIHSLNVCPTANGYCLALANLQSPIIVDISSRGALERISYPTIPVSGQCSSLVHDAKSGIWTAAMRGQISHHIYGTISEEGWWNATASYSCEHRQTSMVKSAALPIESQSLFAVPDGSSTRLSLLNMLGECIESSELHTNSINPILDTILARVDKKIFAGLLSERQLSLFSF